MSNYILLFFYSITFVANATNSPIHPIHISKSDVIYNESEQSVQIALHLFIDDLQSALKNNGYGKLNLATSKELKNSNQLIMNYISSNLEIKINQITQKYLFAGKEYSEDNLGVWCYLEIKNVPTIQELSIKNTVLLDEFVDQKNIVHIIGPHQKKGHFIHQKGKEIETIKF